MGESHQQNVEQRIQTPKKAYYMNLYKLFTTGNANLDLNPANLWRRSQNSSYFGGEIDSDWMGVYGALKYFVYLIWKLESERSLNMFHLLYLQSIHFPHVSHKNNKSHMEKKLL